VIFNQDTETIVPRTFQLILLGLLLSGFWEGKNANLVKVDVIKMIQKYQKEFFKDWGKQIEAVENVGELTSLMKKYAPSVTENLYV
jgi:hypothetical protein